jgi:hypothetical protein
MNEIIPFTAWWIGKSIAAISLVVPVAGNPGLVHRDRKFLLGKKRLGIHCIIYR